MMELTLLRTYSQGKGTNGDLWLADTLICHTIELPWLHNEQNASCIPEGHYHLNRCFSKKFDWHLNLSAVKGRNLISIHTANDAMKELRGCIAPVTELLRPGYGLGSEKALKKLTGLLFPVLKKGEKVVLTIKENPFHYECSTASKSTHTKVL
jgi:hypothetical protein